MNISFTSMTSMVTKLVVNVLLKPTVLEEESGIPLVSLVSIKRSVFLVKSIMIMIKKGAYGMSIQYVIIQCMSSMVNVLQIAHNLT